MSRRRNRLAVTLHHELVHFLHGFTTSSCYKYSLALLSLCKRLAEDSSRGRLTARRLRKYQHDYEFYDRLRLSAWKGLTTRDLMESTALIEGFMASFEQPTVQMFEDHLAEFYPNESHPYRTILELVRGRFGLELAVDLVPRLTFIALNTSKPVRNFLSWLDRFEGAAAADVIRIDTRTLARFLGVSVPHDLLSPDLLRGNHEVHPFVFDYIEDLWRVGGLARWYEYFAKPSRLLRGEAPPAIANRFLPPALVFSGGELLWLGAAQRWDDEKRRIFLASAAVAGACERLLGRAAPYQFCVQTACPVHATAVCHSWYSPPPSTESHESCGFPNVFAAMFGEAPSKLMVTRRRAGITDAIVNSESVASDAPTQARGSREPTHHAALGLLGRIARRRPSSAE